MYFKGKITETEIKYLLENNITEQKELEYKRQIPERNNEEAKIKILQSISSFANTDGGTIIFGIIEKDGGASEILNIETATDDDILWLHGLIKERILPRINPPDIYETHHENKKVYIMDILSSYTKPHFVKGNYVFYGRNNNSKYQLDIADIKRLFLQSKTVEEQFENFRIQRIMKLKSGSFPFQYSSNSIVSVHISSLPSLNNDIQLSMSRLKYQFKDFEPINNDRILGRYDTAYNNYDGCINLTYTPQNKIYSYTQIFRNGIIEAACFGLFDRNQYLYGSLLEQKIRDTIKYYINILKKLNVIFPYFISVSVLNTKGYILVKSNDNSINNRNVHADFEKIFENDILLPTVFIESEDNLDGKLNSSFEVLWNSNGHSESPIKMGNTNA